MRPTTAVGVLGFFLVVLVVGNLVLNPGNSQAAANCIVGNGG